MTFTFWMDKNAKNGQLGQKLMEKAKLWLVDGCSQTVLPDRSVVIGQKLVENAQIIKFKCDILSDFQTLCYGSSVTLLIDSWIVHDIMMTILRRIWMVIHHLSEKGSVLQLLTSLFQVKTSKSLILDSSLI